MCVTLCSAFYMLVHAYYFQELELTQNSHEEESKLETTHNDLDVTFGVLIVKSRVREHGRGDLRKNILSFDTFKGLCTGVYTSARAFFYVGCTYVNVGKPT